VKKDLQNSRATDTGCVKSLAAVVAERDALVQSSQDWFKQWEDVCQLHLKERQARERAETARDDFEANWRSTEIRLEVMTGRAERAEAALACLAREKAEAMREMAAKVCERRRDYAFANCDMASFDPSTGVNECSLEARCKDCLCQERYKEAENLAHAIRALPLPSASNDSKLSYCDQLNKGNTDRIRNNTKP